MIRRAGIVMLVAVIGLSLAATAQESKSEVSLQGAGFFTTGVSGNGTSYSATEAIGAIGTYRFHLNPRVSVEAAYGFNLDTQKYDFLSSSPFRIRTGMHQLTVAFVINLPPSGHSKINPYFLLGGGAVLFEPTDTQFNSVTNAQAQTKGAFVYGLGMNYAIRKSISLRLEYRGLAYGPPDFGFGALATNAVTHTAEPSVGVSFRF